MSRLSYGTDVFSPIRGNSSFNDALSDDFESSFSDLWQKPNGAAGKNENSEAKGEKPYIPFLSKDETPIDKVPGNHQSVVKTDNIIEKKNKKDSSSEADFTRLSFVTTRSKSSHKSKKELGVIEEGQSTQNGTVSKARKKNNATVRPEVDSKKELLPNKVKQNKDSSSLPISGDSNKESPPSKIKQKKDSAISVDSNKELSISKIKKNKNLTSSLAPTNVHKEILSSKITQNKDSFSLPLASLADEQSKKNPASNVHIDSVKSDYNYPCSSIEQVPTHKVLSKNSELKKNHSKSKKLEKHSMVSTKKCTQIEKPVFSSTCKINDLRLQNELNLDKENQGESENSDESMPSSSVSKAEQIQANIIEKLVKDAVSFEFDGIRQMLYLHQLQLLKVMNQNTACCELRKTNEVLVEENRRLKNIIAHQKP